jgi:RNA polymerase sigma-70 factor (TIGR02943 family)
MVNTLNPTAWIKEYADYLYNYAMYRTKNSALSEDLVQDTFVSAYKAKDNFKGNASEKTWLVTILKNKIIDHYRKSSTKMQINISQLGDAADYFFDTTGEDGAENGWRANTVPSAMKMEGLDYTEQRELNGAIMDCFDKLPEQWSAISRMKLLDDMDTEEIAETFNITKSNFWVILHRAKMQLRDCLQNNWVNQ